MTRHSVRVAACDEREKRLHLWDRQLCEQTMEQLRSGSDMLRGFSAEARVVPTPRTTEGESFAKKLEGNRMQVEAQRIRQVGLYFLIDLYDLYDHSSF